MRPLRKGSVKNRVRRLQTSENIGIVLFLRIEFIFSKHARSCGGNIVSTQHYHVGGSVKIR